MKEYFDTVNYKLRNGNPGYDVTVNGVVHEYIGDSSLHCFIPEKDWNEFLVLFFAYISCYNYKHKWNIDESKNESHFGDNIKYGPMKDYLGWFGFDCKYPCFNPDWNDIFRVDVMYTNTEGVSYDVTLPNVEELFETEDECLSEIKRLNDIEVSKETREVIEDEGVEVLNACELGLVRDILRSTGKWSNYDIDNLQYTFDDRGFAVQEDTSESVLYNVLKQEFPTSETGQTYTEFTPETLTKIENALVDTSLSNEEKSFLLDVCKKYNKANILDEGHKKGMNIVLDAFFSVNAKLKPCGPNGWAGIYMNHVINPDVIDLDDYDENEVIKYNGETYIIHESD